MYAPHETLNIGKRLFRSSDGSSLQRSISPHSPPRLPTVRNSATDSPEMNINQNNDRRRWDVVWAKARCEPANSPEGWLFRFWLINQRTKSKLTANNATQRNDWPSWTLFHGWMCFALPSTDYDDDGRGLNPRKGFAGRPTTASQDDDDASSW